MLPWKAATALTVSSARAEWPPSSWPTNGHEEKVGPEDERFVLFRRAEPEGANQLIVVDNFFEELKRVGN